MITEEILASEALPQAVLTAIDSAAQVLCERRASTTPEETERRWREAVLTACGGMPHPGPDAVAQSTVRLQEADANYDGTTTANVEGTRKRETREALLRRAVDKRLHAFWRAYV